VNAGQLHRLARVLREIAQVATANEGERPVAASTVAIVEDVTGHPQSPITEIAQRTGLAQSLVSRTVDRLLQGDDAPETRPWPAALVPHAGLKYSGRIAADVLKRIHIPRSVIVLGPKHTAPGVDWAVAPHQTWALPGVVVESDFMLARQLCQSIPGLEMDAAAHQGEHAELRRPRTLPLSKQKNYPG